MVGEGENESENEPLPVYSLELKARLFRRCVCAYPARREQFIRNTFTPVFDENSPAVADMQAYSTNKEMFPHGVETSMGTFSWFLPQDVACEQKVGCVETSFYVFDTCVPVMIFMGKEESNRRGQKRRHDSVEICETLPPC